MEISTFAIVNKLYERLGQSIGINSCFVNLHICSCEHEFVIVGIILLLPFKQHWKVEVE